MLGQDITEDDLENEKQICAVLKTGKRTINFDNLKTSKWKPKIDSAVLERIVTDPRPSLRVLGTSNLLSIVNTIQIIFTHNGGEFSSDLESRQVPIRLRYPGDPAQREFGESDIRAFALKNRSGILGELLGMWMKWRQAGMPRSESTHRMGYWASLIGGVLDVNGISGFLDNLKSCEDVISPRDHAVLELLVKMDPECEYTATSLLPMCSPQIWDSSESGTNCHQPPTVDGQAKLLGRILRAYLNKRLLVDDSTWVGVQSRIRHKASNYKRIMGSLEISTSPQNNVIPFNGLGQKGDEGEVNRGHS